MFNGSFDIDEGRLRETAKQRQSQWRATRHLRQQQHEHLSSVTVSFEMLVRGKVFNPLGLRSTCSSFEMTFVGSTLSISGPARLRLPSTSVSNSRITDLLVHRAP